MAFFQVLPCILITEDQSDIYFFLYFCKKRYWEVNKSEPVPDFLFSAKGQMYGYLYQLPFLFIVLPIICFTQLHVLYFCSYTLFFYVRNDGFITSHCKGTINNQFINRHLRDNEQQISNLTLKSLLFYFAQFSVTIQQHYFVQTGYFLVFCLSADKIKKSRKTLILRDLSQFFHHLSLVFSGETGND